MIICAKILVNGSNIYCKVIENYLAVMKKQKNENSKVNVR